MKNNNLPYNLYFKDDQHLKLFKYYHNHLLVLNKSNDNYYISFIYLVSATGKDLLKFIDEDGISGLNILEHIKPYSSTEKKIIRLALHLFNNYYEHDSIDDLFSYLDNENIICIFEALKIRYL